MTDDNKDTGTNADQPATETANTTKPTIETGNTEPAQAPAETSKPSDSASAEDQSATLAKTAGNAPTPPADAPKGDDKPTVRFVVQGERSGEITVPEGTTVGEALTKMGLENNQGYTYRDNKTDAVMKLTDALMRSAGDPRNANAKRIEQAAASKAPAASTTTANTTRKASGS